MTRGGATVICRSMLFEHYRALVKAEDAASYFEIKPAEAGNVIAFKATA